jgi:hypothetical protein
MSVRDPLKKAPGLKFVRVAKQKEPWGLMSVRDPLKKAPGP